MVAAARVSLRACVLRKAAAICEAAGLNLCVHSSVPTGIASCSGDQIGRAIQNLNDGNQIMWQLLNEDIVESPGFASVRRPLALPGLSPLRFALDRDAAERAARRFATYEAG